MTHAYNIVTGKLRSPIEFVGNVFYNWKYFGLNFNFLDDDRIDTNIQKLVFGCDSIVFL